MSRGDRWTLGDTIFALFEAAYCNPKAGLNRAGRAIGKRCHGKLNAYKNLKRQGVRMSVATHQARMERLAERGRRRYSKSG